MGGGGQSQQTNYQSDRVGVHKRQYAQLSDNGFQSQAEYDAAVNSHKGLVYDPTYGTYTLKNGVDFNAAVEDWNNYLAEKQEQDAYNAKEERRKEAPKNLTGTTGAASSLTIGSGSTKTTPTKKTKLSSSSPSIASTSQPLGIY